MEEKIYLRSAHTGGSPSKLSGHISGRKRDLLIIASGILLGASTQYLSTHIWEISNMLVAWFYNGIHHDYSLVQECKNTLCSYIKASRLGMGIELAAIIVVIVLLVFFFRRDDNYVTDEIKATKKELVEAIDRLGNRIDRLGNRMRGENATKESKVSKEEISEEDKPK